MREKIARALKARSKAIRNALDNYNDYAAKLVPPRPSLSWTKVIEAVYVADLDILRDTRQDIRNLKWAQPAHRQAMNLHFSINQARVELRGLNVEIRRLITFMHDDHIDFYNAVQKYMITNPPLARESDTQVPLASSSTVLLHDGAQLMNLDRTGNMRGEPGCRPMVSVEVYALADRAEDGAALGHGPREVLVVGGPHHSLVHSSDRQPERPPPAQLQVAVPRALRPKGPPDQ